MDNLAALVVEKHRGARTHVGRVWSMWFVNGSNGRRYGDESRRYSEDGGC